ncbi:MAG: formylglycine-generating enzyme family protein [Acidobacteriota bacterium]|nr:formylglycine-generating enzyme family protein [Acidobacteriota bacterium]MDE3266743.1 formylglycine-generating enzyme family protein [Acidobacteriota bacterium]
MRFPASRPGFVLLLVAAVSIAGLAATPPQAQPDPGTTFRDCDVCPEMVVVPAGSFVMGSPTDEAGRYDDEGPAHEVTIADPFAIGVREVTFAEWDACVAAGGCEGYDAGDEGRGRGSRPVLNANWDNARAYVFWLTAVTGNAYRLPSEAEWEYAARAGTSTRYSWGDEPSAAHANGEQDHGWPDDGHRYTAPAGSFAPNPFGLHDAHGNVWEWTADCWNDSYEGAPTDGSAWLDGDCVGRVTRGGAYNGGPAYLRSAMRVKIYSQFRSYFIGFRVARSLAP